MGFEIKDNILIKYTEETGVTKVIVPDGIISIGERAFHNCENLTNIIIPDSVIHIGSWAFASCISFTSITIPENVNIIEDSLFWGCNSLEKIKVNENNKAYCDVDGVLFIKDKKLSLYVRREKQGIIPYLKMLRILEILLFMVVQVLQI